MLGLETPLGGHGKVLESRTSASPGTSPGRVHLHGELPFSKRPLSQAPLAYFGALALSHSTEVGEMTSFGGKT